MSRTSTLPKRLQPMLAALTNGPFDDAGWVFEDKYEGFRMVAEIETGKVALYSRNGKVISQFRAHDGRRFLAAHVNECCKAICELQATQRM